MTTTGSEDCNTPCLMRRRDREPREAPKRVLFLQKGTKFCAMLRGICLSQVNLAGDDLAAQCELAVDGVPVDAVYWADVLFDTHGGNPVFGGISFSLRSRRRRP